MLDNTYNRDELAKQIDDLQKQIAANDNLKGRISGRLQELQDELEAKRLTLADTDKRIQEQTGKFEKDVEETKPDDYWGNEKKEDKSTIDLDAERAKKEREELWGKFKSNQRNKDRSKGHDLER